MDKGEMQVGLGMVESLMWKLLVVGRTSSLH